MYNAVIQGQAARSIKGENSWPFSQNSLCRTRQYSVADPLLCRGQILEGRFNDCLTCQIVKSRHKAHRKVRLIKVKVAKGQQLSVSTAKIGEGDAILDPSSS